MSNRSLFRSKHGKHKEEAKTRTPGYQEKGPGEYDRELSPLDIIKQDTDVLAEPEEVAYVFKLPAAPQEIADYLGHYFLPAESEEEVSRIYV
jgi:hypothetical protein